MNGSKLGGSVLVDDRALDRAVGEIYRHIRGGGRGCSRPRLTLASVLAGL